MTPLTKNNFFSAELATPLVPVSIRYTLEPSCLPYVGQIQNGSTPITHQAVVLFWILDPSEKLIEAGKLLFSLEKRRGLYAQMDNTVHMIVEDPLTSRGLMDFVKDHRLRFLKLWTKYELADPNLKN